ncbi:RidA family protein [Bradyrhizobium prioriisuperbiae]|uniref:RidA family protein n=1 Tax=Bradyrhizobium prioriisuperbiae TaxID=2854389 RepID=UPI0028F163CE|nr:RidA family protein [Bradyrhizobium prioritasuperba]
MQKRSINAAGAPQPAGGYAQLCEVSDARRWAFVSGQIPQDVDGKVPETFAEQARLVWANIETQLGAIDMTFDNLVKVTTFLSDRTYNLENRAVRNDVLGDRKPAMTVIIAGIFDSKWLLEIEAVAAG